MPSKEDMIEGLLRELAGYESIGDKEGVEAVKAELEFYGFKAQAPAKRAETRPAPEGEKRGPGRPKKVGG